jgi:hypothetical protein
VKRLLVLVLTVGVAASGAGASAAPQSDLVIRPGHGIGKFRLGMTQAELFRAAGRPHYVVQRGRTFGLVTVEYQYGFGAEYIVILAGQRGRLRVIRISTFLRRERTPAGIGPGSLERTLLRVYPSTQCAPLRLDKPWYQASMLSRTCTLIRPSGRRTIFRTNFGNPPGPRVTPTLALYLRYARITEVAVAGR